MALDQRRATDGRTGEESLLPDEHGVVLLDGTWDFFPGAHEPGELDSLEPLAIEVPGLWEAQGLLELDGVAWYRRRFTLSERSGWWSLRFGAVMDTAEIFLNGMPLGSHESAFTPFVLDATRTLVEGRNELLVRVVDPSPRDPEHRLLAHGKQGWVNGAFPGRPGNTLTCGGIWQSVTLRRHGPVAIRDLFVLPDPDHLRAVVELESRPGALEDVELVVRAAGTVARRRLRVPRAGVEIVELELGRTSARRWTPADPVLHDASVDVFVDGDASDSRTTRIGLRTIGIEGDRLLLSGEPFRMKAALVQGFSHERLYAEDERSRIEHEVRAAQAMGFNTLRLHAKAFDPVYLDVCDELGMLAYCDVPVTEPVDHEQLDEGTLLADRCVCAAVEQVRRDRNHPCVLVWSAMNEIGLGRSDVRLSPGYERFVRLLAGAVKAADPTRPLVENDWVEPDPGRVFTTPVVTAHWYGTLHAGFLAELDSRCRASAALGRPLLVSEFGDWGLPLPPVVDDPPFRDAHEAGVAMLAASAWPGSAERFAAETHRAQGLSDRLQTEVFRRHEHVGGYCVTALTDAPHELDGLLDVDRRPKPEAVREMTLANSPVLPLLELPALVFWAGEPVHAVLHVANDGPALQGCTAEIFFRGDRARLTMEELLVLDTSGLTVEEAYRRLQVSVVGRRIDVLEADRPTRVGDVVVDAPLVPGGHELVVQLRDAKGIVAENRYPVHVVVRPGALPGVRLLGTGPTADALREVGVFGDPTGPTVVGEGALEPEMRPELEHVLAGAGTVLVLAQPPTAAACYPAPVRLSQSERHAPGFRFTTGHPALPSLPRCSLLAAEDSSLEAGAIVSAVAGLPFPATPLVIAYAPAPPPLTGCIVGEHRVGSGRLLFCQYGLCEPALRLDAAAQALLADLVAWAAAPLEPVQAEVRVREDGRVVRLYLEQRP